MVDRCTNTGKAAFAAALAAVVTGVCVLAGWLFDLEFLKRIAPDLVAMNPATAVAFILAGASLALFLQSPHGRDQKSRALILTARLCALVVTLIGLAKLVGILFGWDLGVDRWLFASKLTDGLRFPNRIAPNTALNFLLLGSALLLVDVKNRFVRFGVELSAVLVGFVSLLALLAFAYDIQSFHGLGIFIPMAVHTAIAFSALVVALLLSHTDRGLLAVFAGDSAGGTMARRLLPAAVFVPAVLGWLTRQGEEAGLYQGGFSEAAFVAGNILVFTFLVCWSANGLYRADLIRKKAEGALLESEARTRLLVKSSSIGLWDWNLITNEVYFSAEWKSQLGYTDAGLANRFEEWESRLHPEDREPTLAAVKDYRDGRRAEYEVEFRLRHRDGSWRWMFSRAALTRDATGRPVRIMGCHFDITDRKRTEEQLRVQASALDAAANAIMITDHTGTIQSVNPAFTSLSGYSAQESVGQNPRILSGRKQDEAFYRNLWQTISSGQVWTGELTNRRKDGSLYEEEMTITPLRNADGVITRYIAIKHDITERKRGEDALRLSEERFRLFSKATNDAIWDWDLVTNALWWNEGSEAMFGFHRDEIEPTLDAWTSLIHPEDRPRIVHDIHHCIDAGEEKWSGEYRFARKDGTYAYVLDRGYLLRDPAGKPLRMIGGMTDLTERKAAADRVAEQAALLNAASDAIILIDLADHIVLWNRSAEQIYGWTAAEAVGKKSRELFGAEAAKFDAALHTLLARDLWRGELLKHAKDGRILMMDVRWTLVRDEAGQPKSILAIDTDITERKKLEAQFFRVQRMESIGTLAGGIAHDLNNILAPIMMSVSLLQREITSEAGREMLGTLQVCSQRGADLVRQVLSFARGIEGQRIVVNPIHLVREIQKIIRETFPKNIAFKFNLPRDLGMVTGDPTQLHQVLMNLCVNARDAMPKGGALTVTMENILVDDVYAGMNPDAKPGVHVMIKVSDTGTGIPPDIRERIFEPFFTTKEIGKGTGLGLSTTLAIVRSHGGFIHVYSEPGQGTQFKIYLPANTTAAADERVAVERAELPHGHGELVLVADDEESIRNISQKTLSHYGYRVVLAANGAEAVALYAAQRDTIAVVLTDMAMPVMDGPATIIALKTLNPQVKIIGSSGLSVEASVAKAVGAGVKHFIPKPYTAEKLLTVLAQILREPV